jgi:hypothetical protein
VADAPVRVDGSDAAEVRLNRLLNLILESAVEALGFDAATVTTRHDSRLATVAATDQRVIALDEAQYETREGPCLAALDSLEPISLDDAGEIDDRWEYFSRTAAHLGPAALAIVPVLVGPVGRGFVASGGTASNGEADPEVAARSVFGGVGRCRRRYWGYVRTYLCDLVRVSGDVE